MSRQGAEMVASPPGTANPERSGRLHAYLPRIEDRHFWAVQLLVLAVAGLHFALEAWESQGSAPFTMAPSLSFVPVAMFFIPVVYAALNFGFAGSVATALWCTLLSIPNLVLFHHGWQMVAEMVQIGIVDVIAFFVGERVDRELAARRQAEDIGAALRASEMRYRGLFESSPIAILVLDPGGTIVEANPVASVLFRVDPSKIRGMTAADLVGAANAERLLDCCQDDNWQDDYLAVPREDGTSVYLAPTLTRTADDQGNPVIQALLANATAEHFRRAGLRAYAAHILLVQEEERKRIAQELHDETVQKLILLCRLLDLAEGANGQLPRATIDALREARRLAETVVAGLRDFAKALRPPMLDDLGLVTSTRRLLVDITERVGIDGQLKVLGVEQRLSPNTELALFRIAQEALRNVERHAQATQVVVSIAFANDKVGLTVIDNGVGFTPPVRQDFAVSAQLGLLGMRERAESQGGNLEIQSSPGQGTVLTVYIPWEAARCLAPEQQLSASRR